MNRDPDWQDDDEWVDEEGDFAADLLACPACRRAVHEDTQKCPHCGEWITPMEAGGSVKRFVWVTAAVLVIVAMVAALVM